ncbi:PH domain-containing protein [Streptomyces sp. RB6PN25]|uniref:PH domain-containing protein n=1 Tax=Streptomyces humicola TaxID=2953240 RepID=A0ABT1PR09_9ACTN|nr:PH domain-containing protein [Streptomyces humicola]MCQ4080115.1 PH domain-containing protein [Streptomyces humicola]
MSAAEEPLALPVTFRPVRTRTVLMTVGTILLVTFVTVAFAMPGWSAPDRGVFIATGAVIFGLLSLLSRPKIVAAPGGLTVVNLTTKRRLEWAEVLRVNLRPGDPWVYLDLADGTSLAAMGIQPGNGKQRAVQEARRLRALAEAYGTSSSAA